MKKKILFFSLLPLLYGGLQAQDVFIYDGTYYQVKSSVGAIWTNTNLIGHRWSGQQDYTSILVPGGAANSAEIRLMANGNVGVGVISPQSKLAVNGTITAKQVKVTQSGWPDFVFDSTYHLPELSLLHNYILKNRRLPEIPSMNEIEKQGLDLGDMTKKQMQKIEELTLYIIYEQQEIDSLKSMLNKAIKQN